MSSPEVAFYAERIAQKEHELNDLQTSFNKYKLKNSVKFDQLRKEITLYCNNHGLPIVEKENNALLLLRLAEMENALEVARRDTESLHRELSRRQIQMNDQFILIKNLEEQLHMASPLNSAELEERKQTLQHIDLDVVHQQMVYKDERIVELNNVILDKERQILDLQEMCRDQGEVANAKTQAMRIVQKKFEELENRGHREVATETDSWQWMQHQTQRREREIILNGVIRTNNGRSQSPGYAVASRNGSSSPPPLDPSEAENKIAFIRDDDEDLMGYPAFQGRNLDQETSLRKKQRKRVTFDLPPTASRLDMDMVTCNDEIATTLNNLNDENLQLKKELSEKTAAMVEVQQKMQQVDSELARVVRENKAQSLKARAVAQGRIKDLEDRMAELSQQHVAQIDRLQTEIETLRSTREWEVEQNAKLREQIAQIRDKNHKLTEELDASEQANRDTDLKVVQGEELMERMVEDLAEAEGIIRYMEGQKHSILDDVDSLKEALIAQDQFIEILEADIIIYEEHIGILRESLGASKVDHRSLIRSKAFETKLKALEKEKEQINRRSSEDRLRTKALDQKCKMLEEENERLMSQLCEHEMKTRDDADMADTCYQLEERIRLAETRMTEERAEYERRIEAAFREIDRERCNAMKLLDDLNSAKVEITHAKEREQRSNLTSGNYTDTSKEATIKSDQAINKVLEQDSELRAARMEVENLLAKYRQVNEEMETMHGTNFDLMTKSDEINRLLKDAHQNNERLRLSENQLRNEIRSIVDERDTIQQQSRVALDDANKQIELLQKDVLGMKTELENARLSLQETNAVRIELEHLRDELELERSSGRAKWEAVCKKMLEAENDVGSRKNSVEVQQYVTTYEEKIQILEKDLEEAKLRIEQDKLEKKKLKAAIKQFKNKEHIAVKMCEQFPVEVHNTKSSVAIQVNTNDMQELYCLKERIQELELETRISGELNIEFGQAMMEMEEEVQSLKAMQESMKKEAHNSEMELRLHEMLEEELGNELEEMRNKEKELLERLEALEIIRDKLVEQDRDTDVRCDLNNDGVNHGLISVVPSELERLRTENAELREDIADNAERIATYEKVRWQEKEAMEKINQVHFDEVQTLTMAVDEAKRTISITEARLNETEKELKNSQTMISGLQRLLTEKSLDCEKLQEKPFLKDEIKCTQSADEGLTVDKSNIVEENAVLRQCVNETSQMHEEMSQDMERLLELKTELENAVDALKGEIWSLNGQLKASILDRENLQDRIVALDTNLAAEKKRADALDSELQEQTELTEKATRQAAEAENESNRRLAECLEMETIREQLERDYAKLSEYYGQLQAAYNVIYAQLKLQEKRMQEEEGEQVSTDVVVNEFDKDSFSVLDSIIFDLRLDIPSNSKFSNKLKIVQKTIATRQTEAEENLCIIAEQHRINDALKKRLESLEEETQRSGGESKTTKERLYDLNRDLEWKKEECELLQQKVDELQSKVEILSEKNTEDSAAKLTSSQADVNSLFRANAELAHTNVRLQNELDESRGDDVQNKSAEKELIVGITNNELLLNDVPNHLEDGVHCQGNVPSETCEEVLRLKTVEKILNDRIYSLEEQLLEDEEKLQDIEDELHEERERAKLNSIKLASIEHELLAERSERKKIEEQLENKVVLEAGHEEKGDTGAENSMYSDDTLFNDVGLMSQKSEFKQSREELDDKCKSEGGSKKLLEGLEIFKSDINKGWCLDEEIVVNNGIMGHMHMASNTMEDEETKTELDNTQVTVEDYADQRNEWKGDLPKNSEVTVATSQNFCEQQIIELNIQLQEKISYLNHKESEENVLRSRISELEKMEFCIAELHTELQTKATELEKEKEKSSDLEQQLKMYRSVEIGSTEIEDTELDEEITNSSSTCELTQLRSEFARLEHELSTAHTTISELNSQAVEKQEAWCWEEQSNKNELETLRDELRRVQDELDSTECERRRLEDELVKNHGLIDSLNAELELRKAQTDNTLQKEEKTGENLGNETLKLAVQNEEPIKETLEEKVAMEMHIKGNHTDKKLPGELHNLRNELLMCHKKLDNMQHKLEERNIQNDLLKDSESRLIDSVDEYRNLMEIYKEKAEKFEQIVRSLEEELKNVNKKLRLSEGHIKDLKIEISEIRNDTNERLSSQQLPSGSFIRKIDQKVRLKAHDIQQTGLEQSKQLMKKTVIRSPVVSQQQNEKERNLFHYMSPTSSAENISDPYSEPIAVETLHSFLVQGVEFPVQIAESDVIRRRSKVSSHNTKMTN